jgi:hypothetical protein
MQVDTSPHETKKRAYEEIFSRSASPASSSSSSSSPTAQCIAASCHCGPFPLAQCASAYFHCPKCGAAMTGLTFTGCIEMEDPAGPDLMAHEFRKLRPADKQKTKTAFDLAEVRFWSPEVSDRALAEGSVLVGASHTPMIDGQHDFIPQNPIERARSMALAGEMDPYRRAIAMGNMWLKRPPTPEELASMNLKRSTYKTQKGLAALVKCHPFLLHWDTTVSKAKLYAHQVIKAAQEEGVDEFVAKRTKRA